MNFGQIPAYASGGINCIYKKNWKKIVYIKLKFCKNVLLDLLLSSVYKSIKNKNKKTFDRNVEARHEY